MRRDQKQAGQVDRTHKWARRVDFIGHNRVGVSLSTPYEFKLRQLASACNGMRPTTLAAIIIGEVLNSPPFILFLQEKYGNRGTGEDGVYVLPVMENGSYRFETRI